MSSFNLTIIRVWGQVEGVRIELNRDLPLGLSGLTELTGMTGLTVTKTENGISDWFTHQAYL